MKVCCPTPGTMPKTCMTCMKALRPSKCMFCLHEYNIASLYYDQYCTGALTVRSVCPVATDVPLCISWYELFCPPLPI